MAEAEDQGAGVSPPPALYLMPYNDAARRATNDPNNAHFLAQMDNGAYALYISFANPDKQVCTLGRAGCDIFLPDPKGADISKHQCSFINTEQWAVLLEDTSRHKNTEPCPSANGGQTISFTRETRRVLVARGINNMIGIGRDRYYKFEIYWESDCLYEFLKRDGNYRTGPQEARRKRYIEGEKVGGGSFGSVWRVMDVHTGGLMAVKKFHNMDGRNLEFATREITNLFRINRTSLIHHDHILEILDCAGGGKDDNWGEIFMPLKPGNLKMLALDTSTTVDVEELAHAVLHQMLLALACIAKHKIVHRDLKPENVLWEYNDEGEYHFRLGDFGQSNNPDIAMTVTGTEPFMAPEVYNRGKQTDKVDIWSLFATIVWVKNTGNFRLRCAEPRAHIIHGWLVEYSMLPEFRRIRRMASMRAKDRPSAERLLRILATDEVEDMADSLANALTLDPTGEDEDDAGIGPSQGPGFAYYEPYRPNVPENYVWESEGDEEAGEASNTYRPPPMGASPRVGGAGLMDEAYVKPYDQIYDDPNSGTAVPDVRTARRAGSQEMNEPAAAHEAHPQARKSGKGKKKKG